MTPPVTATDDTEGYCEEKACSRCGAVQPKEEFPTSGMRRGKVKRHSWCRPCLRAYWKEWSRKPEFAEYIRNRHKGRPRQPSKSPRHPLYQTWSSMRTRCTNPKARSFGNYGGRGIRVCDRWNSFSAFLEDVGPKPTPGHTLDRIDNDGNYEPGNVRWAVQSQQSRNSRRAKLTEAGALCIRELHRRGAKQTVLAKSFGVSTALIYNVINSRNWR